MLREAQLGPASYVSHRLVSRWRLEYVPEDESPEVRPRPRSAFLLLSCAPTTMVPNNLRTPAQTKNRPDVGYRVHAKYTLFGESPAPARCVAPLVTPVPSRRGGVQAGHGGASFTVAAIRSIAGSSITGVGV